MKTDDEFTALTSKVAGLEQGYKRIVCILALYPLSCLDDRSIVELHPALKVSDVMKTLRLIDTPCHRFGMYVMRVRVDFVWSFGGPRVMRLSEQVTLSGEEHVLVGSLDLNQGRILPGEISGSKPEVGSTFLARTSESSRRVSAPSRRIQVTPCSSACLQLQFCPTCQYPEYEKSLKDVYNDFSYHRYLIAVLLGLQTPAFLGPNVVTCHSASTYNYREKCLLLSSNALY